MKKIVSLLLTLALCMGLTIPAFAGDDAPDVMGNQATSLSISPDYDTFNNEQYTVYTLNPYNDFGNEETINGANVIGWDATITVSNHDTDKTSYVTVYCYEYYPYYDEERQMLLDPMEDYVDVYGKRCCPLPVYLSDSPDSDWDGFARITSSGKYWSNTMFADETTTRLYSGESVSFDLPSRNPGSVFKLYVEIYYPEYDYSFWKWYAFVVDPYVEPVSAGTVGSFTDVKTTDYFADAVKWAVEKKITDGTSATTFSPEITCTTAHILTFMWRAAGCPEPTAASPFTNLKGDEYYAKAAVWAYEQGMISGTTFDADKPCTRATTMEYFWKQAGSPKTAVSDKFTDVAGDASYAQAVAWAVANGVTLGTGDDTFSPDATCTRGQIVTFLNRALVG